MLIKEADDSSARLQRLEAIAAGAGPEARQAADELRMRKAGLKGESESAYLIDFTYGHSPNWAVIHDLRLEHRGRVAQIDHVLVNRWMDVYVLETKHFHTGLKITEEGEFLRWNDYRRTFEGMPSPLEQNERHIAVLRDVMAETDLPVRLGIRLEPSFHSYVLVSPKARVDRPRKFDSSRVVKADQLKSRIWKELDDENPFLGLLKAAKIVSRETVEFVARQLAALHRPLPPPTDPAASVEATPQATAITPLPDTGGPACRQCGGNSGAILYGNSYYFKCDACGTNTPMRPTCLPGHRPRLRKQGLEFFRECAECGTRTLYHRNPG